MKKKVLTTMFSVCLLLNTVTAQTIKDYKYYNHKLDSLITAYAVDTIKRSNEYYILRFSKDDKLSTQDKMKLIKKTEKLFEQNKYTNLYELGKDIVYNLYFDHKENNALEIQQKLMEICFKYYFYPPYISDNISNSYRYEDIDNYSTKAKKEILNILKNGKTEKEFELWLKYEKSSITETDIAKGSTYWRIAERLMKKREIQNDTICRQIIDSIITADVYNAAKREFDNLRIDNDLIRLTGLLDMKECIPYLLKELDSIGEDRYRMRERNIRFALARMGDKEQKQYIMNNFMNYPYFSRNEFNYFKSDEMIWKYIDVNYHSKERVSITGDFDISAGLKAICEVYRILKYVPQELEYSYKFNFEEIYKWSEKIYKWLMENKNSVQFNYEGNRDCIFYW